MFVFPTLLLVIVLPLLAVALVAVAMLQPPPQLAAQAEKEGRSAARPSPHGQPASGLSVRHPGRPREEPGLAGVLDL